jgi:hypothetical protein
MIKQLLICIGNFNSKKCGCKIRHLCLSVFKSISKWEKEIQ